MQGAEGGRKPRDVVDAEGGGRPSRRTAVEVYDSAGVRIVVNHADTAFLPLWTVDTVPVFRAGHHLDDIHHQFVQIKDARLRSDGRVVVGDVRTHEHRLFDSDRPEGRFDGAVVETPGIQRILLPRDLPGPGVTRTPYAPTTWVALDDDRSHVAVSTRFEVRSYDAAGAGLSSSALASLRAPI